jgi:hypothetical protein
MSILNIEGRPITTDENGVVKAAHDPERVHRRRTQLHNQLEELQQGWHKDNAKDAATSTDDEAIDDYWKDRWKSIATTAANAKEPVLVEMNAMADWITAQRTKILRGEQYEMMLKDVADLSPWSFKLVGVGDCTLGTVWLSDRCAVCIDKDGMVLVHLRSKSQGLMAWAERAWLDDDTWKTAWELPDLQLGELFQLLKLFRYTKLSALPEPLMAIARCDDPKNATPARS